MVTVPHAPVNKKTIVQEHGSAQRQMHIREKSKNLWKLRGRDSSMWVQAIVETEVRHF